jgi:hypothetical protein
MHCRAGRCRTVDDLVVAVSFQRRQRIGGALVRQLVARRDGRYHRQFRTRVARVLARACGARANFAFDATTGDLVRRNARPSNWNASPGESAITQRGKHARIERVYLEPEQAPAYPDAVRAILSADLIVAGPGSLFTQRPAEPAGAGHSERVARVRRRQNLCVQRGNPARRNGRLYRRGALRRVGTTHRRRYLYDDSREQQLRGAVARRFAQPVGQAARRARHWTHDHFRRCRRRNETVASRSNETSSRDFELVRHTIHNSQFTIQSNS